MSIQPRLIRKRDAPAYLGMSENVFVADVEPKLVAVPIGTQGVAYDRLDLDDFADKLKAEKGYKRVDGKKIQVQDLARDNEPCLVLRSNKTWQRKASQGLSSDQVACGTSTSRSRGSADFAKALALTTGKKQKPT